MSHLILKFQQFDRQNPHVWNLFVRFAFDAINSGHRVLSASLVTERIRWETTVVTFCEDGFKICNNHRAYYARKFNRIYPQAAGKFKTRLTKEEQLEWRDVI